MSNRFIAFSLLALGVGTLLPQTRPRASPAVTVEQLVQAFNRHDLDAVMSFFDEDCTLDMPRGPDPWGQRFIGKTDVRKGLASRFEGIPDVYYGEDRHWVAGNRGISEWTLTGHHLKVRGCDLCDFRSGKIERKDSFWKM